MVDRYNPQEIEKKWQERRAADRLYQVKEGDSRPKWYELTMFPYTSGDFAHRPLVCHGPADTHARFRQKGDYDAI